jgi:hypothetical protein
VTKQTETKKSSTRERKPKVSSRNPSEKQGQKEKTSNNKLIVRTPDGKETELVNYMLVSLVDEKTIECSSHLDYVSMLEVSLMLEGLKSLYKAVAASSASKFLEVIATEQ